MTSKKVELYADLGGLRDLSTYSAEDVASLPPLLCEAFKRLQSTQAHANALRADHADALKRVAECDKLTDDLTRARNLDYPPITAQQAREAVVNATRRTF